MTAPRDADPPAPLRRLPDGRILLRHGGGLLSLVGAVFLMTGLGFAWETLRGSSGAFDPGGFALALLFVAIGVVMVFGRKVFLADPSARRVSLRYSILIPFRSEERRVDEFESLAVGFQRGSGETRDRYPVALRARSGRNWTLTGQLNFARAFAVCEYLSASLGLPMVDATTDHERVVDPVQPGRARPNEPRVPRPAAAVSQVVESHGEVRIAIPTVTPGWVKAVAVFVGCSLFLVLGVLFLGFFTRPDVLLPFRLMGVCAYLFVCGAMPFAAFRRREATVTASAAGISVLGPGRKKRTIAAADIVGVDSMTASGAVAKAGTERLTDGQAERLTAFTAAWGLNDGIIIKTRQGQITLGENLRSDELNYLSSLIRSALGS